MGRHENQFIHELIMEINNKQLSQATQQILHKKVDEVQQDIKAVPVPKRFYCHWTLPGDIIQYDPKHPTIPLVDDPHKMCCFNHHVGLPTRKFETDNASTEIVEVELTHFNHRMMRNYFRHRKYSQNKCRGNGTSEILSIRYMIFKYGVMNTVQNRKGVIQPGTSLKLAGEFSTRIKEICDRIPHIYAVIPTSLKPEIFWFKTGGRIQLTSAAVDAVRGNENIGDLDEEEVAHWILEDDKGVYFAGEGVHNKTQCHIMHNTTPRGKRGFYWDLVWSPDATSDFYKHVTNWREVVGLPVRTIEELYDVEHIDTEMLQELRKQCVFDYYNDPEYREWYMTFERADVKVFWDHDKIIPIEELIDIPIPILEINSIVSDSRTDRDHYDQELDNQFISGENRAIGDFEESDFNPDDLYQQIQLFNKSVSNNNDSKFDPKNFE